MQKNILLRLSILFFVVASFQACQKNDTPPSIATQTQATTDYYRIMHVAYYRDNTDGQSIGVRFYESERIYNVSKNTADFTDIKSLLDQSRDQHNAVVITTSDPTTISYVRAATIDEETSDYGQGDERTPLLGGTPLLATIIPSMAKLNNIFAFMQAQGCATGTSTIDYCIPFQYVVDGCYARAHKMRQILNYKYGYYCQKVFSYEGATGSLAVDAGDCCVYWWYHVAPLVSVQTDTGVIKLVMDPSMFNMPVSIATWTSAQQNITCTPNADFGHYEIEPGRAFWPGGPGGYGYDDNYSITNYYLQLYGPLETCN